MLRTSFFALAAALAAGSASAQDLTQVTFGTNWLAQAEHGGFYQSVADGTYAECGLDVTIITGGPQVNNRALLLADRIQFHMGGDLLQAFNAAAEEIPVVNVAAIFQKHPQVILAHPGVADSWEELKDLTLADRRQRLHLLLPVDDRRARLHRRTAPALHLQPRAVPRR
jgi:NitT/TauT family transport system substrate-binding protein